MIAHAKTSTSLGSFPFHPMSDSISTSQETLSAKVLVLIESGLWTVDCFVTAINLDSLEYTLLTTSLPNSNSRCCKAALGIKRPGSMLLCAWQRCSLRHWRTIPSPPHPWPFRRVGPWLSLRMTRRSQRGQRFDCFRLWTMDCGLWTVDCRLFQIFQIFQSPNHSWGPKRWTSGTGAEGTWSRRVVASHQRRRQKKRKTKVTAPVRGRVFLMMFQPSCLEDLLKTHAFCNFAIHSGGNVNVMIWIPCKGYRLKPIISTFAAFLLHFPRSPPRNFVASHVATQVTQAFVQALLAATTPHPCIDIGHDTFGVDISMDWAWL